MNGHIRTRRELADGVSAEGSFQHKIIMTHFQTTVTVHYGTNTVHIQGGTISDDPQDSIILLQSVGP